MFYQRKIFFSLGDYLGNNLPFCNYISHVILVIYLNDKYCSEGLKVLETIIKSHDLALLS